MARLLSSPIAHTLVAFGLMLATAPAAAATEIVLGKRPTVLELEAAVITVTISDEPARLTSAPLDREAAADGDLDVRFEDGGVQVLRPPAADDHEEQRPRIDVSVWIRPGQPLRVVGRDLDITVTGLPAPEAISADGDDAVGDLENGPPDDGSAAAMEPALPIARQTTPSAPHDPNPAPRLEIAVADSTVTLDQTVDSELMLDRSRLRTERTRGTLRLVAENGSEAELIRHRGSLDLEVTESDAVVVEAEASIDAALDTANILFQAGSGTIAGHARGGLVVMEGWQGTQTIRANATAIEARESGYRTTLIGSALEVTAEKGRGELSITSDQGGIVRIDEWTGRTSVDLPGGGTLDASELKAPLTVVLAQGGRGEVTEIQGMADITLRDAELTLAGARNLRLQAADAYAVVSGVTRLDHVQAERSRIELEMTEARAFGQLVVDGESDVTLALREPCRVIVSGTAGRGSGEEISANRCFVHMEGGTTPGQPYVPRQRGQATVVRVELATGGRLAVDGYAPP